MRSGTSGYLCVRSREDSINIIAKNSLVATGNPTANNQVSKNPMGVIQDLRRVTHISEEHYDKLPRQPRTPPSSKNLAVPQMPGRHGCPIQNFDWLRALVLPLSREGAPTDRSGEGTEINRVIQEAYDGSTVNAYMFWLADDAANAPLRNKYGENTRDDTGTVPPIDEHWRSPFIGKTALDAVSFLKSLPDDRSIDWHYFAVLGSDYKGRGMVTIYRIGDVNLIGEELESLPCSVAGSTLFLSAMEPDYWEETKSNQRNGNDPVG
ncbi:hypothetical protein P153DRAFT_390646 [Dothidotthia symphoricarpi CBS 119687]|uniref:Uncharacterized protein n=1 Tax=Dothidotthia symphoricarpi CBS 119687 TaxID=1392245 RepID=A0A6A6A1K8_9PLEO|nr:uncharacterized protein P153DRAFT_390646 [Dothidotthia symphoricarpi CBS 119687]KAF2124608.1 hypothetical protein P153DRAFT_390646 [Dothidotthia symphoricarpi CBS 119687]